jgi:3-hydroxyisobutyrate dehydrogenase-like beta-hydroxyacid dehydrogenase
LASWAQKWRDLAEAGGIAAVSPRDVAEKVEILITSLPSVDAFEQMMAGQGGIVPRPDSGLGSGGSGS